MTYIILIAAIVVFIISLKGVIKRYNNLEAYNSLYYYRTDVLGLLVSFGFIVVMILKLLGYNVK